MADDLRQRYAEAIRGCGPLSVTKVLYAVMAVRDSELESLRERAETAEAELRENEGVIKALRRQRDEAEAAIARAHEVATSWRDDAMARSAIRPTKPEHAMWAAVGHVCTLVLAALDSQDADRG